MSSNHTPINDLINKNKKQFIPSGTIGQSKESGPIHSQKTETSNIQEVVEHKTDEETQAYVQPRAETIELPPDLKHFGLQPVNNTQFPSYNNINLPIPDEKIIVGLHAPITSSIRWLATFAIYLLKKAHLGLRVVQGKVVRIIKP